MKKEVFKEISVRVILLSSDKILTASFNGDYSGVVWEEDEYEG